MCPHLWDQGSNRPCLFQVSNCHFQLTGWGKALGKGQAFSTFSSCHFQLLVAHSRDCNSPLQGLKGWNNIFTRTIVCCKIFWEITYLTLAYQYLNQLASTGQWKMLLCVFLKKGECWQHTQRKVSAVSPGKFWLNRFKHLMEKNILKKLILYLYKQQLQAFAICL